MSGIDDVAGLNEMQQSPPSMISYCSYHFNSFIHSFLLAIYNSILKQNDPTTQPTLALPHHLMATGA